MHRGDVYGSSSSKNQLHKTFQGINQHKLMRQKRFLYDNDNSDAVDDWRDVLDDAKDYKEDLVDMFRDGARTFFETFFPCFVTDSCDDDEEEEATPAPAPATSSYKAKPMPYKAVRP